MANPAAEAVRTSARWGADEPDVDGVVQSSAHRAPPAGSYLRRTPDGPSGVSGSRPDDDAEPQNHS